ncbi:hypothetical protein BDE02_11G103700 [Populus trichocarpa]|nr:hypothetical protein BDE02_11G103700 [Populus trichocarpa]
MPCRNPCYVAADRVDLPWPSGIWCLLHHQHHQHRPSSSFCFFASTDGCCRRLSSQLTQNSDLRKGWQAILVHHPTAARATSDFAGDIGIGAFPFEVSEEENILTMDSVEGVPDLERLTGIEVAISNRSRGGKARVSEFGIQKEAHQFFIIRVESITRE